MGTKSKSTTPWKARSKPSKKPWQPHAYQRKAVKWLIERPQAGLFLDPGLGKTSISLAAFKVLQKKGYARAALVVAPLRVAHSVWPAEVQDWADFEQLSVGVIHGPKKAQVIDEQHDVYAINYEGLQWLVDSGGLHKLVKERKVGVLIWDELSKMKNPTSKRYKLIKKYLHLFAYRWGLTGSPASNGLMDVFGQIYVLDRGQRLGQYITHFRNRFFTPNGPWDWVARDGAKEEIQASIKDIVMHMSAEDYLELPPQHNNIIRVELDFKARKLYDSMEDELLGLLDDGVKLTAATAAAALNKCKQIANGAAYLDTIDPITGMAATGPRQYEEIHNAKIEALLDLIEEHQGQPILIAYEFKHDLDRLLRSLPKGTPFIGGGTSAKDAARLEAEWNRNDLPILLGHPASIGHGLNLQKGGARTIIWFSPTWDFELYDQFNRRLRRQGNQADRIIVHHLVARDTVDEAVMGALRNKDRNQKALLAELKVRRRR